MSLLKELVPHADNAAFRAEWREIKQANKARLAEMVQRDCGVAFDTNAMFDVQVKRIHEYKRQLLNVLHVIHLYDRIKRGDTADWTPRCVLIGGKAAPGYMMAKRIIKLVNAVGQVVNTRPGHGGFVEIGFSAELSGIGDGSDLCRNRLVGADFHCRQGSIGNRQHEVHDERCIDHRYAGWCQHRDSRGGGRGKFLPVWSYCRGSGGNQRPLQPGAIVAADDDLRRVMHLLESGHFNLFEPGIFDPIIHSIYSPNDPWLTAADFRSYVNAQQEVARAYRDTERWTRMSIINTATSGKFSSDRTILDYNRDIWHLPQVAAKPVKGK